MNDDYFEWTERLFDPGRIFDKPEALEGVRVVEVAHIIMGPVNADYLGEFGAEVIKVELPGSGDNMRYVIPDGRPWKNGNPAFFNVNHGKYHIGLDLHTPEGQALFCRLVARADVLVENLVPGTLEEWGIGYRALSAVNPRLVYVADSGFGQWGPFSVGRASYDGVAQVASGLAAISGFPGRPPLKIGVWIGDYFGAILAATAVLAALEYRERAGRGQYIDFAQSEGLIRAMDWTWLHRDRTGRDRERSGNRDQALAPSDIVTCRDGMVAIAAATDEEFQGLALAMGQPELADDPRWKALEARLRPEGNQALCALVADWASRRTLAEIEALAVEHGFAAAPVLDATGIHAEPHFRHRRAVFPLDDPVYGPLADVGPAPKLSATPGRHKWTARPVGFHNEYVFTRLLGLGDAELRDLEARGVIGQWADRPGARPPDGWAGEGAVFASRPGSGTPP
jgi:crotonobetainyl-CoA:carnitine CoA-transferase CaiB-like acyl-CoA transferase